jgi:hypothetical protein
MTIRVPLKFGLVADVVTDDPAADAWPHVVGVCGCVVCVAARTTTTNDETKDDDHARTGDAGGSHG